MSGFAIPTLGLDSSPSLIAGRRADDVARLQERLDSGSGQAAPAGASAWVAL